jgi:hypothetical protein
MNFDLYAHEAFFAIGQKEWLAVDSDHDIRQIISRLKLSCSRLLGH